MITVICEKFNTLDQKNEIIQRNYDDFINHKVDFCNLKCSCGHDHCLTKHAYYFRTLKTLFGSFRIRILRVKCSICCRTHAIMISCIIPYSQILLKQHMEIITHSLSSLEDLMIRYMIDEAHIRYIKRQYHKHWKQNLSDLKIAIDSRLSLHCFHYLKKQFMQIRNMPNIHFFMND